MSLLVVGTVAFDEIETPFGKSGKIVGGAASYICLAAAHFTTPVNLVSVIGNDFPEDYIGYLRSRGVRTEGLQVVDGGKSFYWAGRYHMDMNNRDTLVTELNVLEGFDPVIPDTYQDSRFVMLGNLLPQVQIKVLERMKKRPDLVVMDTMNYWMDTEWDALLEVIRQVDVLTINDEEARQLSGEYSLVKAARKILDMGPKYLVVKKGEHGALLFDEHRVFYAPALPLEEVFDPTGAGDSFAGGFIGYLAKTNDISFENMKRALIYGSAMASFCVEKFGTERMLNLRKGEIRHRVERFVELTHFSVDLRV